MKKLKSLEVGESIILKSGKPFPEKPNCLKSSTGKPKGRKTFLGAPMIQDFSIGKKEFTLKFSGNIPYFLEKFCIDIETKAVLEYYDLFAAIRSDLHLYDDNDKLEVIKTKLIEIRRNLECNSQKIHFSVKDIKIFGCLTVWLHDFFNEKIIHEATGVEYSKSIKPGEYDFNFSTKILTVHPPKSNFGEEMDIDFSLLDEFKPLVQYTAWAMFFLKLKKMDAKIKKKIKSEQENENHESISSVEENIEDIETDCFDKSIHEKIYLNTLEKVQQLTEKNTQLNEAISEKISQTFQKTTDRGGSLSSLIESPHLNDWVPKLSLSDNYIEGSQPVANRFRPDGPNWELVNAGLQEGREEYFEITKRADIEAMKERNATSSNLPQPTIQEENVSDNNTIPLTSIELKNNTNPDNERLDAEHFIGFMKGQNLNGEKIMNEGDYTRLLEYTQDLMDNCRVPQNIKRIPKIKLTKQAIIYTYSKIHDYIFPEGKRRQEYFIFLDKVFSQLHQSEIEITDNYMKGNCYKKFGTKPDHYDKINKL